MILMENHDVARESLEKKVKYHDTLDALDHIEFVKKRVIREKLSPKQANELLEEFIQKH